MSTVAGIAVSPDHFIDGDRVPGEHTFTDISPIDQSVLAEVARGGPAEVERAVAAATRALPGWAALGAAGRAVHLRRLADLIDQNIERIAAVECLDMAMLERSLKARVIARGARNYRAYADLAVPAEDTSGSDDFGYWAEDRYFVERLRTGQPVAAPAGTLQDALVTMELVDAFLAGWG